MENAGENQNAVEEIKEQVLIRPVESSDYSALETFLNQFGEKKKGYWLNRFKLWWESNPVFTPGMARGWVIDDEGCIVGFIGVIPMLMRVAGENTVVYGISSWNVNAQHRAYSMALFFKLTSVIKKAVLFDTTPSDDVVEILKAFKFKTFSSESRGQSIVPIRVRSLLIEKLKMSRFYQRWVKDEDVEPLLSRLTRTFLSGMISMCSAAIAPAAQLLINRSLNIRGGQDGLVVHKQDCVDSKLEELWHRTKDRYLITNVRNSEILAWSCFSSPSHLKELFVCYEGAKCVGYIIGRVFRRDKLRVFECMDIWLDPMYSFALDALVEQIAEYCRAQHVDAIQIPHFSLALEKKCQSMGLFRRETTKSGWLFKAPKQLDGQMTDLNTYFCRMQGDNGL